VEIAGWRAYLPAGCSHTPNDNNSVVVVILAIFYSGGVQEWRVGVLGVVCGEWRWGVGDLPGFYLLFSFSSSPHFLLFLSSFLPSSSPSSSSSSSFYLVTLAHGARQSLNCQSQLCEASAKCEVVEGYSRWVCWLSWGQLVIEQVTRMCPVWVWLVQMEGCDGGRWWVNKRQHHCGCAQFPFKAYAAFCHGYRFSAGYNICTRTRTRTYPCLNPRVYPYL
jgi:hypothetical protein